MCIKIGSDATRRAAQEIFMNAMPTPIAAAVEAIAPKAPAKKTIVFDCNVDLQFDKFGAHEMASGTAGRITDDVLVVMRNCSIVGDTVSTKEGHAAIRAAGEESEADMLCAIRTHYRATGRASSAWEHAMSGDADDGQW